MMEYFKKINYFFDKINSICSFLVIILLIFITLSIGGDAILRYLLRRPQMWVSEATELCLPLITFLGTAWLLRLDGHVKIDIFIAKLNPRAQAVLNIINSIFGVVIALALLIYGIKVTWEYHKMGYFTMLLKLPMAPFLSIIPIGAFLLLVEFLRKVFVSVNVLKGFSNEKI